MAAAGIYSCGDSASGLGGVSGTVSRMEKLLVSAAIYCSEAVTGPKLKNSIWSHDFPWIIWFTNSFIEVIFHGDKLVNLHFFNISFLLTFQEQHLFRPLNPDHCLKCFQLKGLLYQFGSLPK